MQATFVLMAKWPITRMNNPDHPIFKTHEMLTDVFVSDTMHDQSLRDVLADGAVLNAARRAGLSVEVIVHGPTDSAIVDGFCDIATTSTRCADAEAMLRAVAAPYAAEQSLRLLIVDGPLKCATEDTSAMKAASLAANSKVAQAIATMNAFDLAHSIVQQCAGDVFVLSYGAKRFRNNEWEPSSSSIALYPSGKLSVPSPIGIAALPTLILSTCFHIGTEDCDLCHHDGACVTIDSTGDMWSCTCRLLFERERYEVTRFFPAQTLDDLPKAFLSVQEAADWVIRDNVGAVDNLAEDASFVREKSQQILSACMPSVRDVVRRRSALVSDEVLVVAETKATIEDIVAAPDDSFATPEELTTPPPSTPTMSQHSETISWRTRILHAVQEQFGDSSMALVSTALEELKENTPYTLIIGNDDVVQILHGALPPTVLEHIAKEGRQMTLLTNNGHSTRLFTNNGVTRVGRVRLDLQSALLCEWLVIYVGKSRMATPKSRTANLRNPNVRSTKLVRRIEQAKALMYR